MRDGRRTGGATGPLRRPRGAAAVITVKRRAAPRPRTFALRARRHERDDDRADTNVVKHARATRATVWAAADDGVLTLEVGDDGIGGAQPDGHGLTGIADRIETLGGRL